MKRYEQKFKAVVKEADDNEAKTLEAVKALIDMKDISNEDEQGKFIELLKGIVFADNKHGDEFLKKINDFTSSLKIEDFKEGCKKGSKKKDMKEATVAFYNIEEAEDAIAMVIEYLAIKLSFKSPKFFNSIGFGILKGIDNMLMGTDSEEEKRKFRDIISKKVMNNIKMRIGI